MKNKKHIDIIVKYFHPITAGIEINVLETHRHFLNKGWTVTVHTSKDTLINKNVLKDNETVRGIKVKRYKYGFFGFFPKIDWSSTDVVSLHNFNVFPHIQLMVLVLLLKILNKKKFIFSLTPHGGFNPDWRFFNKLAASVKGIYHFTLGVLLINFSIDVVRVISQWEYDQIISKRIYRSKVSTITNGIEDEAYLDEDRLASKEIKNKVKSYGNYIIQIGRVHMIKNYETSIKALTLLPRDINYVIVGPVESKSYKKDLEKLIKELGLQDRVIFVGVIRGIDKYFLIKHAQLMVHMALYESFGNAVHEGMSKGLVCVVADNTALKYLIKKEVNGYRLDDYDYRGVANKINYVLSSSNTKNIKQMNQRNIKFGLRYSWKITSDDIRKVYETKLNI